MKKGTITKRTREKISKIEDYYGKSIGDLINHLHNDQGLSFNAIQTKFKEELNCYLSNSTLKSIAQENNISFITRTQWINKRIEDVEKVFNRNLGELLTILHHEKKLNCGHIARFITKVMKRKGYDYEFDWDYIAKLMERYKVKRWKQPISETVRKRNLRQWRDKDYRERMVKMLKENYEKYQDVFRKGTKEWWSKPENRKKIGEKTKKLWENPEFREYYSKIHSIQMKEVLKDPKRRKKMSEISKKLWENEELRKKMAEKAKERWDDPEFREKLIQKLSDRSKPTSIEEDVERILKSLNVSYWFNQPIVLSKRCIIPDFLIKGRKVIEVQGTYWHADPRFYDEKDLNDIQKSNLKNDQEKYKVYKENGYDVLYVWEYDIENHPEKVRKQIKEFLKK